MLSMFQLAVVRGCGKRAFRLQMFWRAILWTLPAVGFTIGCTGLFIPVVPGAPVEFPSQAYWAVPLILVSVAIPLLSMLFLKRGLLDRLAGTYLVPR